MCEDSEEGLWFFFNEKEEFERSTSKKDPISIQMFLNGYTVPGLSQEDTYFINKPITLENVQLTTKELKNSK